MPKAEIKPIGWELGIYDPDPNEQAANTADPTREILGVPPAFKSGSKRETSKLSSYEVGGNSKEQL